MRKAQTIFEMTKDSGIRLIVAGDQNVVFKSCIFYFFFICIDKVETILANSLLALI